MKVYRDHRDLLLWSIYVYVLIIIFYKSRVEKEKKRSRQPYNALTNLPQITTVTTVTAVFFNLVYVSRDCMYLTDWIKMLVKNIEF